MLDELALLHAVVPTIFRKVISIIVEICFPIYLYTINICFPIYYLYIINTKYY